MHFFAQYNAYNKLAIIIIKQPLRLIFCLHFQQSWGAGTQVAHIQHEIFRSAIPKGSELLFAARHSDDFLWMKRIQSYASVVAMGHGISFNDKKNIPKNPIHTSLALSLSERSISFTQNLRKRKHRLVPTHCSTNLTVKLIAQQQTKGMNGSKRFFVCFFFVWGAIVQCIASVRCTVHMRTYDSMLQLLLEKSCLYVEKKTKQSSHIGIWHKNYVALSADYSRMSVRFSCNTA